MSDLVSFASLETDLERLRLAAQRAGEAFGLVLGEDPDDDAETLDDCPSEGIELEMRRFVSVLGVASVVLLLI